MTGSALQPVIILREPGPRPVQLVDIVEKDGLRALDRWIDQPAAPLLAAAAVDELG